MKYTDYFEFKTLKSGEGYICLKEGAPELLRDFIRELHMQEFDKMPNDWIYDQIYHAFEALENLSTGEEFEVAMCHIEASPYTSDLYEWAKEFNWLVDEAHLDNLGLLKSVGDIISTAQVRAIERIYNWVWKFLTKDKE